MSMNLVIAWIWCNNSGRKRACGKYRYIPNSYECKQYKIKWKLKSLNNGGIK